MTMYERAKKFEASEKEKAERIELQRKEAERKAKAEKRKAQKAKKDEDIQRAETGSKKKSKRLESAGTARVSEDDN